MFWYRLDSDICKMSLRDDKDARIVAKSVIDNVVVYF